VNFYDQVLREIVAAIGAALVVGNGLALMRRRRDAERAAAGGKQAARSRQEAGELAQAPVGRTAAFLVLGLVMLIAGVAALVAG